MGRPQNRNGTDLGRFYDYVNALLDLEDLEEDELDRIRLDYSRLAKEARAELQQGISDTDHTDMDKKDSSTAVI
jgi:hypothetical protein